MLSFNLYFSIVMIYIPSKSYVNYMTIDLIFWTQLCPGRYYLKNFLLNSFCSIVITQFSTLWNIDAVIESVNVINNGWVYNVIHLLNYIENCSQKNPSRLNFISFKLFTYCCIIFNIYTKKKMLCNKVKEFSDVKWLWRKFHFICFRKTHWKSGSISNIYTSYTMIYNI